MLGSPASATEKLCPVPSWLARGPAWVAGAPGLKGKDTGHGLVTARAAAPGAGRCPRGAVVEASLCPVGPWGPRCQAVGVQLERKLWWCWEELSGLRKTNLQVASLDFSVTCSRYCGTDCRTAR